MANNDRTRGLAVRRAAGGVVYHQAPQGRVFLLIRDPYGRWSLPKGHLEDNESDDEAALREVAEETGVHATLGALISQIRYHFPAHGRTVEKRVSFFLMQADTTELTPQTAEGISDVGWFSAERALQLIDYDQVRQVFTKALDMLDG
jgi:8-oxo-dGTP diphosphatase